MSDLVFTSNYKLNENINFSYNGAIDQNYNDINYSDLGSTIRINAMKIDFNYLEENKHIGDQEYFKTKLSYEKEKSAFSFETKKDLILTHLNSQLKLWVY